MSKVNKTALIMAAGTGGHIYPGLAIADVLVKNGWNIVWLATPTGMEHKLVGRVGYPIEVVQMSGVRSKGLLAWTLLPLVLLRAFWQALAVIRRVKPDVVISMGGYIAFPGGMMGVLCGKPLVVHEPGAHAGLTNRVLALIADRVLVGFPKTFDQVPKNALAKMLPKPKKVEWLGTPVRGDITELPEPSVRMAGREGPVRLLIVGGSLGAKTLNELVLKMLQSLPQSERPLVVHQSGESHFEELMLAYREARVAAEVVPFVDDMAKKYEWCDVMLCRSGAITVAEIAAAGVASVLVPLPYFVAEEQEANARFLADANAGIMVKQLETTPQMLAEQLKQMTRRKLLEMATIARTLGKPDATARCARACTEAAGMMQPRSA
ncbi:MAG: undecaprenyldiphospho-muramoylpentapeptide beta-N-acetylglucosaminyltransferase [Betaproteobacteria bacterium]|nr:undecaprenyldiphospho-muramoylpentapeptide beta-N-acetylglucosaminyltransferase [Betaproteobacteria bacterium]